MCNGNCKQEKSNDFTELDKFIESLEEKNQSSLIKVMHHAQELYGYLSNDTQSYIAKKLNVAESHVYGVLSFYAYFTDVPRGEHIVKVCMGTACYVKGAGKILDVFVRELGIKAGETSKDLKFTLEATRCIGACGLAPVFTIGEEVFGNSNETEALEVIRQYING